MLPRDLTAMDALRITQALPFGIEKEGREIHSALFEPWRRLAETGKPTGTANFMFLDGQEAMPIGCRTILRACWQTLTRAPERAYAWRLVRVLGAVCHTPGGQLLYFPGFTGTSLTAYDHKGRVLKDQNPFLVDHFTLESNFRTWHITPRDAARNRREPNLNLNPAVS